MKSKTLNHEVTLSGIGIHSGQNCVVIFKPSNQEGIRFIRKDLDYAIVNVDCSSISHTNRATILKSENTFIKTPEHLLSACYGLGINSLDIELDSEEIPILDGSALNFTESFLRVGLKELETNQDNLIIKDPIHIDSSNASLIALPSKEAQFTYMLSYPNTFIGTQIVTFFPNSDDYASLISPARTYGFEEEVKALLNRGLAKGGNLENAVVIGKNKYLNSLRFPDELARHKLLDMLGDLAVIGKRIQGHVLGFGSGHQLNMELALKLVQLNQ